MTRRFTTVRMELLFLHLIIGTMALFYVWFISQTIYVRTGLQFISPVLIIMLAHGAWIFSRKQSDQDFLGNVLYRSLATCLALFGMVLLSLLLAPMPAESAGIGDIVDVILGIISCLIMVVAVMAVPVFFLWLVYKVLRKIISKKSLDKDDSNETRLFEMSGITVVLAFLIGASLEGVPGYFSFEGNHSSSSKHQINVATAKVWQTLQTATSPDFPLPTFLEIIPRPVEVELDEGVELNDKRIVRFVGREGEGCLILRVTKRTQSQVEFTVLSDSSPMANWIKHKKLIYSVMPHKNGSQLQVTLEYERLLSPAWFFKPVMSLASYMAVDVLAKDVKKRAEL